ncbi:MAG: DUF192 domain-containing protein [Pseudomonadota bacterium]
MKHSIRSLLGNVPKTVASSFTLFASLSCFALANAQDELTIESGEDQHVFSVEVVSTAEDIERGLMGREELPADSGMLFDFVGEQQTEMWMKDTPLLLDMLFIDSDGTVVAIARNAAPGSERRIGSGVPVRAVLELNGGTTQRLGIQPGDSVAHSILQTGN